MASKPTAQKSSGMVYIYSTLANSQLFVQYAPPTEVGMFATEIRRVHVNGGAGIASKHLITSQGAVTAISQEDYEAICELKHFKDFVERGHIRVDKKSYDIEKIVGDMNSRDPSAPLTPSDFVNKTKGLEPVPVELAKAGTGWVTSQLNG